MLRPAWCSCPGSLAALGVATSALPGCASGGGLEGVAGVVVCWCGGWFTSMVLWLWWGFGDYFLRLGFHGVTGIVAIGRAASPSSRAPMGSAPCHEGDAGGEGDHSLTLGGDPSLGYSLVGRTGSAGAPRVLYLDAENQSSFQAWQPGISGGAARSGGSRDTTGHPRRRTGSLDDLPISTPGQVDTPLRGESVVQVLGGRVSYRSLCSRWTGTGQTALSSFSCSKWGFAGELDTALTGCDV